jgi:hypothetical protein
VTQACVHSYSGGSNQEDHSLGKYLVKTYLKKNPTQKRTDELAQDLGLVETPVLQKKRKDGEKE